MIVVIPDLHAEKQSRKAAEGYVTGQRSSSANTASWKDAECVATLHHTNVMMERAYAALEILAIVPSISRVPVSTQSASKWKQGESEQKQEPRILI